MKVLYVTCLFLCSNLVFASQKFYKDILCDNGKTVINRVEGHTWGVESYFKTTDPDILHFIKHNQNPKGQILAESTTGGIIKGEFIYTQRDWQNLIPEKSITVNEITTGEGEFRTLELTISQARWLGCVKEEVVSGCYAGDECITRCIQQVAIPEVVYFSKKIDCKEQKVKRKAFKAEAVFHVKPGMVEEFRREIQKIIGPTLKEAGNISYEAYQVEENGQLTSRFEFHEIWRSRDAMMIDHIQNSAHMKKFFAVIRLNEKDSWVEKMEFSGSEVEILEAGN